MDLNHEASKRNASLVHEELAKLTTELQARMEGGPRQVTYDLIQSTVEFAIASMFAVGAPSAIIALCCKETILALQATLEREGGIQGIEASLLAKDAGQNLLAKGDA
jgi:hypothetical protein